MGHFGPVVPMRSHFSPLSALTDAWKILKCGLVRQSLGRKSAETGLNLTGSVNNEQMKKLVYSAVEVEVKVKMWRNVMDILGILNRGLIN